MNALLLIDHGSRRAEANEMLETLGQRLRHLRPDLILHWAHMELAQPDIPAGIAACLEQGAKDIVVFPYMLSPGRHVTEDIPRLVAELLKDVEGVNWRISEPLGLHNKILEIILERTGL